MGKLMSVFDVLRKGSAVADPALLKNRGGLTLALTALLWSVCSAAKAFGYDIQLTQEDIASVAGTVALVVGLYVNYASSEKVGILPAKVQPDRQPDDARPAEPERTAVDRHQHDYPRDQGGGG